MRGWITIAPTLDLRRRGYSPVGTDPTTDQRGVFRPRDGDGNGSFVCDVGAYER